MGRRLIQDKMKFEVILKFNKANKLHYDEAVKFYVNTESRLEEQYEEIGIGYMLSPFLVESEKNTD
jgi:hypothetical protein